jgi:hypothetical protein
MNRHCILAYQNREQHNLNVAGIVAPAERFSTISNIDAIASWLLKNNADKTIRL